MQQASKQGYITTAQPAVHELHIQWTMRCVSSTAGLSNGVSQELAEQAFSSLVLSICISKGSEPVSTSRRGRHHCELP